MAASLEILVCGRPGLGAIGFSTPFAIVTSSPAKSHRGKASLWQKDFDAAGGTLFHIGDLDCLETERYWAFEIIDEISMTRYRLLPKYRKPFWKVLKILLQESPSGTLLLSADDQFGPKPKRYVRTYSLKAVQEMHRKSGLRRNSLMKLCLT